MSYNMRFTFVAAYIVLCLLIFMGSVSARAYPAGTGIIAEVTVHQLILSPDTPYPVYTRTHFPNVHDKQFELDKDISVELAAQLKKFGDSDRLLLLALSSSPQTPAPVPETLEVCLKGHSATHWLGNFFSTANLSLPLNRLTDKFTSAIPIPGALDANCSKVILSDGSVETLQSVLGEGKSSDRASFILTVMEMDRKENPHNSVMGFPGGQSASQLRLSGGTGNFWNDQDYKPGFGGGGPHSSGETEILVIGLNQLGGGNEIAATDSTRISDQFIFQITDSYGNERLLIKDAYELAALFSGYPADWLWGAEMKIQGVEPELVIRLKEWTGGEIVESGGFIGCPVTRDNTNTPRDNTASSGSSPATPLTMPRAGQGRERSSGGSGGDQPQSQGYCDLCHNLILGDLATHIQQVHETSLPGGGGATGASPEPEPKPELVTLLLDTDFRLSRSDHNTIMDPAGTYAFLWRELAIKLNISESKIKLINHNNKGAAWPCMNGVISEFFKGNYENYSHSMHTWNLLITAAYGVDTDLATEISDLQKLKGKRRPPKPYIASKRVTQTRTELGLSCPEVEKAKDSILGSNDYNSLVNILEGHSFLWEQLAEAFKIPEPKVKTLIHDNQKSHDLNWHMMSNIVGELVRGNYIGYSVTEPNSWNRLIKAVFQVDQELAYQIFEARNNSR